MEYLEGVVGSGPCLQQGGQLTGGHSPAMGSTTVLEGRSGRGGPSCGAAIQAFAAHMLPHARRAAQSHTEHAHHRQAALGRAQQEDMHQKQQLLAQHAHSNQQLQEQHILQVQLHRHVQLQPIPQQPQQQQQVQLQPIPQQPPQQQQLGHLQGQQQPRQLQQHQQPHHHYTFGDEPLQQLPPGLEYGNSLGLQPQQSQAQQQIQDIYAEMAYGVTYEDSFDQVPWSMNPDGQPNGQMQQPQQCQALTPPLIPLLDVAASEERTQGVAALCAALRIANARGADSTQHPEVCAAALAPFGVLYLPYQKFPSRDHPGLGELSRDRGVGRGWGGVEGWAEETPSPTNG